MKKVEVTYQPSGKVAHVPEGTTVFNAAHWAGLPIESSCGGRGTCGKCSVQVLEGDFAPTPADARHLTEAQVDEGWRISCQAVINGDALCDVPRLISNPKAATMGVNRFVLLEPNVWKGVVDMTPPTLEDARSHVRRVLDFLEEEGWEAKVDTAVYGPLANLMTQVAEGDIDQITAVTVEDHFIAVEEGDTTGEMYGVALDIGTTTDVATLIDLRTGGAAAVASSINRQASFGGDVIARMAHAMKGEEQIEQLREAVVETINDLLDQVYAEAGVMRDRTYEMVVVGNATMLHLFLGVRPDSIAVSPFTSTFLEPLNLRATDVGVNIHPQGRVQLFPSLGAYVGADLVGDVVATGLAREDTKRLIVDVGTNGEIIIGSADRIIGTAAPAGPAFEGAEILHGMRATDGAIEGITLGDDVELQIIGGNDLEAKGLCGSGLIDAVAQLRLVGIINEKGGFKSPEDLAGHPLADRVTEHEGIKAFRFAEHVLLTQKDIREMQFAKGAIATGVETAMREIGWSAGDLDEVCLAGSFGSYINPESAKIIGLVPAVPVEKIKAIGNAASEGAKMALMSFREREVAFELPTWIEYLELSGVEDFNDRFIQNLGFPELEAVSSP
ncbi:MAG: ASKHA domain-containing protein [Actinomycetota bacterium]